MRQRLSEIDRDMMIPMYWRRVLYEKWSPQAAEGNPAWGAGTILKSTSITVAEDSYVQIGTAMTSAYNYSGIYSFIIYIRADGAGLITIGAITGGVGYFCWPYNKGENLQAAGTTVSYDICGAITGDTDDVVMTNAMWHVDIARA